MKLTDDQLDELVDYKEFAPKDFSTYGIYKVHASQFDNKTIEIGNNLYINGVFVGVAISNDSDGNITLQT